MVVLNGEVVIIDVMCMVDVYINFVKEFGVIVKYVFDIYFYVDYILGGRVIVEVINVVYWLFLKDVEEVIFDYKVLEEGSDVVIGNIVIMI